MADEQTIEEKFHRAVAAHDGSSLEEAIDAMWTYVLEAGSFPAWGSGLLQRIIRDSAFQEMEGSWHLFKFVENIWDFLSDEQKTALLPALEATFGSFTDFMSWFVMSELLGEYFANEASLNTLVHLKKSVAEGPRSLVPHGLEHFVKSSKNELLREKAYDELLQMGDDPSEQVRHEVILSMQRLANRGFGRI